MFDFVLKFPIESAKSAALIVWFIEREAVVSQGTKQAWDWEIASALRINFARSARNLSKSSQISTLSLLLFPLLFYSILFILNFFSSWALLFAICLPPEVQWIHEWSGETKLFLGKKKRKKKEYLEFQRSGNRRQGVSEGMWGGTQLRTTAT